MPRYSAFMYSAALSVAVVAAPPAFADVTPQQVWDDIEAYMTSFGYEVAGTETLSGSTLSVKDMVLTMDIPDGEGVLSFSAADVVLEDAGNGSVRVSFPADMPITLNMTEVPDGEPFDLTIDYTQDGLEMIVSGTPGDLTYDYTANSLGMRLTELVVDGEVLGRDVARADITLTDISGNAQVTVADIRTISQVLKAASVDYDIAFNDPEAEGSALFAGSMAGLLFEGSTSIPLDMNPEDMPAMLAAGFAVDGTFGHSGGSGSFAVTEDGEVTTGRTSSGSGTLQVTMNADALAYSGRTTDVEMSMTGGELPFPVETAMSETAINLTLPTSKGDEPSDVAFGVNLAGFTMSDMLWNIFDPGKALPRDPATLAFDLTGKVKMLVELMDAEQMAMMDRENTLPAEPQSLTLSGLLVEAIGARLTGEGSFTFDNTDLETFDGMPRPTGTLNLTLDGANAVLDRLIAAGLMKQQDAMGARMMLSMFAVAGSGEDQLKSTLEINESGQILANGQRIR